jgi:hypothetical protein
MYPSAINVPRFRAICARLTPPIGVGGRNWDTQFGLPVLSIALKNSPGVGTVSESIVTAAFSSAPDNGEAAGVGELPPPVCCAPKGSTAKMAMILGKSHFQGGAICTAVYQQSRTCPALRSVSRLMPWGSDGRERTFSGGDELPLIRFFIGRAQVWYRF